MFKPRQQTRSNRGRHPQNGQPQQNPISDMEQFYLQQYFGQGANRQIPPVVHQPHPLHSTGHPSIQAESARWHQLELRIARLEAHLGFTSEAPSDFSIR